MRQARQEGRALGFERGSKRLVTVASMATCLAVLGYFEYMRQAQWRTWNRVVGPVGGPIFVGFAQAPESYVQFDSNADREFIIRSLAGSKMFLARGIVVEWSPACLTEADVRMVNAGDTGCVARSLNRMGFLERFRVSYLFDVWTHESGRKISELLSTADLLAREARGTLTTDVAASVATWRASDRFPPPCEEPHERLADREVHLALGAAVVPWVLYYTACWVIAGFRPVIRSGEAAQRAYPQAELPEDGTPERVVAELLGIHTRAKAKDRALIREARKQQAQELQELADSGEGTLDALQKKANAIRAGRLTLPTAPGKRAALLRAITKGYADHLGDGIRLAQQEGRLSPMDFARALDGMKKLTSETGGILTRRENALLSSVFGNTVAARKTKRDPAV